MTFFDAIRDDLGGHGLLGGNFQLRLVLQPLVAVLLGLRFGIRDAKQGREPFFMSVSHSRGQRGHLIAHAARDALIPLVVALILDAILQHMNNGRVRPLGMIIVSILLVFLPFLVVRALANRAWRHRHRGARAG